MRSLSTTEVGHASGGFSIFGITEISSGLALMGQARAIAGNAAIAYGIGYAIGTGIYQGYEWIAGDSLGGDLYDLFNC